MSEDEQNEFENLLDVFRVLAGWRDERAIQELAQQTDLQVVKQ